MADKKSFFESISEDCIFDDEFYKKVYGYSLYDKDFLNQVTARFKSINRSYAIKEYNDWVAKYEHEYLYGYIDANGKKHMGMKDVSYWYANIEWPRQWEEIKKKYRTTNQEGSRKDWNTDNLLQKKKELLLKKKLLLLN